MKSVEIEFAPHLPNVKVEPFFKIDNKLIDSSILCMLSGKSILLYLVLVRRSYNNTGYIYTEQIVTHTNIDKTHVARHITELVKFGLISIISISKKYRYKKYRINARQDTNT